MGKRTVACLVAAASVLTGVNDAAGEEAQLLMDHTCTNTDQLPETAIEAAKTELHIAYNHTSHGSQLISGIEALGDFPDFGNRFQWSDSGASGLDLDDRGIPCNVPDLSQGDWIDDHGVTPWVTCTRDFLDSPANSHINVIMCPIPKKPSSQTSA